MTDERKASDGHGSRQAIGRRWQRVGLVLLATALVLYGLWAALIAQAFGPGSSDEIVPGGLEAVLWFGLSAAGLVAAGFALWNAAEGRLRSARWSALLAAACLAGWTVLWAVAG